jgi:hypothetical protein
MLRDTTPTSIETKASVYNMSMEEKTRRELCLKNRDFFYDRTLQYVKQVNSDVDPIVVNLTAPVVKKKISLLYNRELQREFVGPAESVSFLEQAYTDLKIDRILRNVDLAAELTGTGLVFVGIDEDGYTYLRIFDAADFSVIQSESNQEDIEAICLTTIKIALEGNNPKDPNAKRFLDTQIWTNDSIVEYKDGIRMTVQNNEFGFLPFVAFKGEEVYNQYLGHAPTTMLTMLNANINQMLTNVGYMTKMQSASPIVVTGFENGQGLVVHPGQAISLPAGATASVLSTTPKITESMDTIKYLEEKFYETSSIPKVSIVGDSDATSGKQLMIKWSPLVNVFKEKSSRYEQYELNLANMILAVNDMPEITEIKVRYPEEALLPLADDMAEIEQKMALGLLTPIDVMLNENPTLSEAEAEATVRANIVFNESIKPEPVVDPLAQPNGGLDARTNQ